MKFTRGLYHVGQMSNYLYTRVVMSSLYFNKNSTQNLFVAKIPVDEGLKSVGDVEVVLNEDTKEIILIAKRKPAITIDAASASSPAFPLEAPTEASRFLEPIYNREPSY